MPLLCTAAAASLLLCVIALLMIEVASRRTESYRRAVREYQRIAEAQLQAQRWCVAARQQSPQATTLRTAALAHLIEGVQ